MAAINWLFPPKKIHDLPSWRFVLHFIAPEVLTEEVLAGARTALSQLQFKALSIAVPTDSLQFDAKNHALDVPVEVADARRKQPGSLEDYESDFWKIFGTLLGLGFGDVYYQAVDWRE
ncbi:MAG TPA: hypothetical protein VGS57_19575 [Thermoanaerobaculia bacterium]|nr:hypothetical protein [Thermoanaerobaculia bacterium]